MKSGHKIILFEKSLRTGLLLVYFLLVMCVSAGCGSEDLDMLLSDLRTEEMLLADEECGDAESDYADAGETDVSIAGLQRAQQSGSVKELLSAEPNVGSDELQGSDYSVGAKELQGTEHSVGSLDDENPAKAEKIYVHVCGEVKNPGVYELPVGSRFYEAVEAAGGFTEQACQDYLNMAASLSDGSRLEIPAADAVDVKDKNGSKSEGAAGDSIYEEYSYYTMQNIDGIMPADAGGKNASDGLVNINTADIAGLCALPGIGEGRAKAIVEYREKQGGFRKKEDIMQVSGIGEKMYARMEDYLTVE